MMCSRTVLAQSESTVTAQTGSLNLPFASQSLQCHEVSQVQPRSAETETLTIAVVLHGHGMLLKVAPHLLGHAAEEA